jgi:lysophospholipase L1-like esterase
MASLIGRIIDQKFMAPARAMKATQFERLRIEDGDIVFLGDSITEGGAWAEWFPGRPVKNRGIAGDSTAGVLARISTAISPGAPAAVFLLIGTNDFRMGVVADEIVANVRQIIVSIQANNAQTRIFVQSIMPRESKLRSGVTALNVRLADVAAQSGVEWIDLWPALADGNGGLKADYTLDHLHLTGAGYVAWVEVLRPLLEGTAPHDHE